MARKQLRTKGGRFNADVWKAYRAAVKAGDDKLSLKLRNQLVEENRPLAVHEAAKFQRQIAAHCDLQDLIQCACIGLLQALEKFDPEGAGMGEYDPKRGGFSNYACFFMSRELKAFSKVDHVVAKPLRDSAAKKDREAYTAFLEANGRPPTKQELGGKGPKQIARALEPKPIMAWIDSPRDSDTESSARSWYDMMPAAEDNPEENLLRQEREFKEFQYLARLPRDEHLAVVGFVVEGRTYREVGKRIGVYGQDVKKLVQAGLARMKAAMQADRELEPKKTTQPYRTVNVIEDEVTWKQMYEEDAPDRLDLLEYEESLTK